MKYRIKSDSKDFIAHINNFNIENDVCEDVYKRQISYIEIPNMNKNLEALETVVKFIYDNIQYAEFNTKSDYCHECGFDGEIIINKAVSYTHLIIINIEQYFTLSFSLNK